ncbi:hypothetical protein GCM10025883_24080 [Mobilicoccus caccae]|uniref:Aldehyde dehydrogenase domain-containing protein n=1 Tax=Mobilicoccus caccae TaxID=1859295 RepID=A0ABQ6ISU6_9MICO|nr:hypothetical protein GCM10025883_24080 [Mobilicoccus caccae]
MTSTTATSAQQAVAKVPTGLFIDGEWSDAASGATTEVVNPATGEVIATIADGGEEDARRAIEVAARTQATWGRTPPRERSEILRRAYELVMERQEELALVMTTEMGKPLAEAKGEVAYAAEFFRWFSEEAVRIGGDATMSGDGKTRIIVTKEPVGPCVLVTPWNFPLAMGTRKIGPAIAAGCTMVFKPAHLTPLSSFALTEILTEAGLPPGVLNVVCTSSAGSVVEPWMDSGLARKISFTGSTAVGVKLLEQASRHVMRSSMELGGNAPFIVFDDADLDVAVEGAMVAKMRNMGRPAPPPTGCSYSVAWQRSSGASLPSACPRSSWATAPTRTPRSVRWSRRRHAPRSRSSSPTPCPTAHASCVAASRRRGRGTSTRRRCWPTCRRSRP